MEQAPPPPYLQDSSSSCNNAQQPRALARKPVPGRNEEQKSAIQEKASVVRGFEGLKLGSESISKSAPMQRKPVNPTQPSLDTDYSAYSHPPHTEIERTGTSVSTDLSSTRSPVAPAMSRTTTSNSTSSLSSHLSTTSSHFQTAYREARHFAGGLIYHPAEITKHFSILRHSHGLVFYQGTSTSVAISLFSDAPLPPNRTLWLQNKGWTGKTGMGLKSLVGHTGNWLDVTPSVRATAEQLKPSVERAWQRDITHFLKRASHNIRESHKLQETIIVRIPVEAEDGYFRLVLCAEGTKKVLCPSPVFRILSTSATPSSIRGASLSTLPLELGAKLATTVANTVVQSHITAPIISAVQSRMPSWVGKATAAYNNTTAEKVDSTVGNVNEQYNIVRQTSFNHLGGEYGVPDEGPKPPYPFRFDGYSGLSLGALGMPVATLSKAPEIVLRRLDGFYFGWARILSCKKSPPDDQGWYQAVVSALPIKISQLARVRVEDVGKKVIDVSFIDEHQEFTSLENSQIEVRVLGFLRPHEPITGAEAEAAAEAEAEAEMLEAINDVMTTQALLSRPAWGPDATPVLMEEGGGPLEKIRSQLLEARLSTQKRVDSIPLHRVGVRVAMDGIRDKSLGTSGGIYIVR